MNIEILNLKESVEIEKQEKHEQVLVTITADIKSDTTGVIAAGIDVDGLEVLPSARIELVDGVITKKFPPIKIFRQYPPNGGDTVRDYKLTVAIGTGQKIYANKDLEVRF